MDFRFWSLLLRKLFKTAFQFSWGKWKCNQTCCTFKRIESFAVAGFRSDKVPIRRDSIKLNFRIAFLPEKNSENTVKTREIKDFSRVAKTENVIWLEWNPDCLWIATDTLTVTALSSVATRFAFKFPSLFVTCHLISNPKQSTLLTRPKIA